MIALHCITALQQCFALLLFFFLYQKGVGYSAVHHSDATMQCNALSRGDFNELWITLSIHKMEEEK